MLRPSPPNSRPRTCWPPFARGGYTIVVRHARTDQTSIDEKDYSLTDRTTQRNLSGAGVGDAKLIGKIMRDAKVPFGEIIASPMFRTMETAQMAFGTPTASPTLRQVDPSPEQRALIAKAPAPGTNRALVTHHFVIERNVPGITPGAIGEGEAVVVRTAADGSIELVGRFLLADWQRLAGPAAAPPQAAPGHGPGPAGPTSPFVENASPATKLAAAYIRVFSSGDESKMQAFLEQHGVPNPERPMAQRLASYRDLFARLGAMEIVGTDSASAAEATIRVKFKSGPGTVTISVTETEPVRFTSIRLALPQG